MRIYTWLSCLKVSIEQRSKKKLLINILVMGHSFLQRTNLPCLGLNLFQKIISFLGCRCCCLLLEELSCLLWGSNRYLLIHIFDIRPEILYMDLFDGTGSHVQEKLAHVHFINLPLLWLRSFLCVLDFLYCDLLLFGSLDGCLKRSY